MLMVAFHKSSVRNAESDEPAGLVSRFWPPPPSPTLGVNLSEAREKKVCSTRARFTWNQGSEAGASLPQPVQVAVREAGGEQKRETLLPGSSAGLGLLPPRSPGGHGSSWGGWSGGERSLRRPNPGRLLGGTHTALGPRFNQVSTFLLKFH